jgi:predicted Holliday junction resolvase-like endonuclease
MSKKNVMNSDYLVRDLTGVIAQTAAAAADVATVAPLLTFTAKKTGYVGIDCDYAVSNGVNNGTQLCFVDVSVGRTAAALGTKIP